MSRVKAEYVVEAGVIASAVRRIMEDGSIVQEAKRSIVGALDILGLSGNAREAVRPLLVAATSADGGATLARPDVFWAS
ncbi:MAG: hypothetical protein ACRDIY_22160 [Chloroflexota bacterium]